MKLLIVEDEEKTGYYLKQGLEESGFVVELAQDGLTGLHLAQTEFYDLLILDVMLPKLSGWQILETLRRALNPVPILVLTARDTLEDKIKGFELNADDYLVKPFAFAELLARIKSLLRRTKPVASSSTSATNNDAGQHFSYSSNTISTLESTEIDIADLHIDRLKHRVYRANKLIHLTPKEFQLLLLLAEHQGEVLTRTLIASRVWDINFDSDTNIIDVAIKRLRRKIDDEHELKLIHTARGMGYFLDIMSA